MVTGNKITKLLTETARVFVGILFILSGLIKQNDPIGFSFKLEEYFEVLHIDFLIPFALYLAVFLCALEIILGIALLVGWHIKETCWGLWMLTLGFTFLTFYSAYYDVVKTCGCFGDALVLSPWQSFGKDVILLFLISLLILNRQLMTPVLSRLGRLIIVVLGIVLSFGLGIYSVTHVPMVDFLPYKTGQHLPELLLIPEGAELDQYQVIFTLQNKNTQELKEIDDKAYIAEKIYADADWVFVKASEPMLIKEGYKMPIADFIVTDSNGDNATTELLSREGYCFWLVGKELPNMPDRYFTQFNEIAQMAEKHNACVVGLTALSLSVAEEKCAARDGCLYDIYFVDAVPLKSMVRAEYGVVLVKDGTIVEKWNAYSMPSAKELERIYFK